MVKNKIIKNLIKMGNNVVSQVNNFCGCKENEESEKARMEKVSNLLLTHNNNIFILKRFSLYYRISKKVMIYF